MEPTPRRQEDDRFEQFSRGLIRWFLGTGLLSVHMAAFFLTLVALLLWNYARSPDDLWVAEPLRRWGLVVVFHATAVAVGWTAWRLMRLGQSPPSQPTNSRTITSWQPNERLAAHAESLRVQTVPDASSSATAEEWARKWLRSSVRIVRDAVGPRTVTNGHEQGTNGNGHATSTPSSGESTEWGALFIRRTREMMASVKDQMTPQGRSDNGATDPTGSSAPGGTWPASTNGAGQSFGDDANSSMKEGTWPDSGRGGRNLVDPTPNPTPGSINSNGFTAASPEIGSQGAESETAAEEARWTWVETAAAAWMTRNEPDEPASDTAEGAKPAEGEPPASK